MKTISLIIILLFLSPVHADESWWVQTGKFAGGAVVGFVNHEMGHVIVAELYNEEIRFKGTEWECKNTCDHIKEISAGGFLAQTISSRVILKNELEGRFWEGWVTFNGMNAIGYIVRNEMSNRRSREGYGDLENFSRKQQYWIEAALLLDVISTYKKWPVHWMGKRLVYYKEF